MKHSDKNGLDLSTMTGMMPIWFIGTEILYFELVKKLGHFAKLAQIILFCKWPIVVSPWLTFCLMLCLIDVSVMVHSIFYWASSKASNCSLAQLFFQIGSAANISSNAKAFWSFSQSRIEAAKIFLRIANPRLLFHSFLVFSINIAS